MTISTASSWIRRLASRKSSPPPAADSSIPHRLHFVWGLLGGGPLPKTYRVFYEHWLAHNEAWDAKIHEPDSIRDVAENFSSYGFHGYPTAIQRCDACRPMLLHQLGGVYTDLDVEPHRPLSELFARYPHANVLVVVETELTQSQAQRIGRDERIRNGVPELPLRIANYFMASAPGHPFWLEVMELMKQRAKRSIRGEYDVLYTTGPDVITEVAHRAVHCYSDVAIVPKNVIDQYITHHCTGSWRGETR